MILHLPVYSTHFAIFKIKIRKIIVSSNFLNEVAVFPDFLHLFLLEFFRRIQIKAAACLWSGYRTSAARFKQSGQQQTSRQAIFSTLDRTISFLYCRHGRSCGIRTLFRAIYCYLLSLLANKINHSA